MTIWRRFAFAGFESAIYRSKRWYSFTHTSRAPSAYDFVKLRGFRVSEQPLFCCTQFRYFLASGQAKPKPKVEGKGGDWRKPNVEDDVGIRINEAINEREVRLVTDQGHRVVSIQEALYLARKLDLDLVEVQRKVKVEDGAQYPVYKPAVCKFMDYCKEKYKQDVKEKERAKNKAANALRNGENKEVRFKAKTEPKDLKIKAESVKRLMERGYRVKCTAMSTGKEDDDLGGLLLNLLSLIEDISAIESGPHLDTKNAYVIVKHIKYASKKGKKISKALETLNSVLSTRSNSAADSNNTSKDENSSQSEEEWEAVESDSEIKIDDQSKQVRTNAQSLSNPHPASPQKGFGSVPDWSGFKATDEIKADITSNTKHTSSSRIISASEESVNKSSGRNTAGFHPLQPEPYVAEPNRYSKSSNSTFNQTNPMNRGPSFPWKAGIENRQRIPEQRNRREIDGHIRSNPNDRPAHNYNPNSSPARHGAFGPSQSPVSNDRSKAGGATMPNPNEPKAPQQSYGIFSSTKSSSSADERHTRDIISRDRVSKSNSPTSNYGIFSTPKTISTDDQMKLRNSTRDNSTRFDPGYNDSSISNNESSPSPRFGIFTSSKKASSGDGRNVDKS